MSYFAELDAQNIVARVIVAESAAWCEQNLGGKWVQTKDPYNPSDKTGVNYAGIGHKFEKALNGGKGAFVEPKPFDSWILDAKTARYVPPVPMPSDGKLYKWDEKAKGWIAPQTASKTVAKKATKRK